MTGFVQIIELKTSRIDEIRDLVAQMRSEGTVGTALRGTVTEDRDRLGYYLNIVEFKSYESAMENSARPEVSEFAAKLAALCDEPPRFYNLDVVETWSTSPGKATVAGTAAAAAGVAAAGIAKVRQRLQGRREQTAARGTTSTATAPPVRATEISDQTGTAPTQTRFVADNHDGESTPPG
jgi:hypothetical protein